MNKNALIHLRKALEGMEQDLGLSELNSNQKALVYGAWEIADSHQNFMSDHLRAEEICKSLPYATYHRCLAQLIYLGIFEKVAGSRRNRYKVVV